MVIYRVKARVVRVKAGRVVIGLRLWLLGLRCMVIGLVGLSRVRFAWVGVRFRLRVLRLVFGLVN